MMMVVEVVMAWYSRIILVRSRGPSHPDRLWEMRRPNALVGLCSDGERRHHGTPLHLLADWSDAHWKQKRPPVPPRGTKSSRHPLHISFLGPHHVLLLLLHKKQSCTHHHAPK